MHVARTALIFAAGLFSCGAVMADSKFDQKQEQPLFMAMPQSDPQLVASVKAAQQSLPQFRQLVPSAKSVDDIPMVKTYFSENNGKGMWLWLAVDEVTSEGFLAHTFEAPPEFPDLKAGTHRFVKNSNVADWAVTLAGVMHGGYSLRLQRARLPEAERSSYDSYIGADSYAPLPAP